MTTPDNTHDLYEAGIDAALHSLNRITPAAGLEERVMARLAQQAAAEQAPARRRSFRLAVRISPLHWRRPTVIATASAALLMFVFVAAWQMHQAHTTAVDIAAATQEPASNVALPSMTPAPEVKKDIPAKRHAPAEQRAAGISAEQPRHTPLSQQEQMLLSLVRSVPANELPLRITPQQNTPQQTASSNAVARYANEADQPSTPVAVADPAVADPAATTTNGSIHTASYTESMN